MDDFLYSEYADLLFEKDAGDAEGEKWDDLEWAGRAEGLDREGSTSEVDTVAHSATHSATVACLSLPKQRKSVSRESSMPPTKKPSPRLSSRGLLWAGNLWLAGCLLAAATIGWLTWGSREVTSPTSAFNVSLATAATAPESRYGFKPIEEIRVGQRVAQDIPSEVRGTDFLEPDGSLAYRGPDRDPANWRLVKMTAEVRVRGELLDDFQIEMLQHVDWLKEHRVAIGHSCPIPLDLEEMGVDPTLQATPSAILPCPAIQPGNGGVVLTTVNHFNTDLFDLVVRDANEKQETIGVTGFHKFYSATRQSAVDARDLSPGEVLVGDNGEIMVVGLNRDPGKHRVYNMTVQGDHAYRVSLLGVLTHNNIICGRNPPINLPRQTLHTNGTLGKSSSIPA